MNNEDAQCQPWIDENGKMRKDPEISKLGRSWNQETWDSYLNATLRGSRLKSQEICLGYRFEDMADESFLKNPELWSKGSAHKDHSELHSLIKNKLTAIERKILWLIFWDCVPERVAAEMVGLTRASLARQKMRTINKLRELLENPRAKKRVSEGVCQKKPGSDTGSTTSQIEEIYEIETSGKEFGKFR